MRLAAKVLPRRCQVKKEKITQVRVTKRPTCQGCQGAEGIHREIEESKYPFSIYYLLFLLMEYNYYLATLADPSFSAL